MFENKLIFISGGSKGIGLAIGEKFAEQNADVFLVASNNERLNTAQKLLQQKGNGRVATFATDLRTLDGCNGAAEAALSAFGRCDTLINAAGATKGGIFPDQPDEEMLDGFALKFHGAVRTSRALWPALVKAKGSVINIVGGFARTPAADFMVGGAVNAALANFSKALAAKGLIDDVNVNWIHPGLTVTERLEGIFANRAAQQGKSRDEVEAECIADEGIRRLGQPEDIAELVSFLCSPKARHIHGTGIACDGGGAKGYY